MKMNDTVARIVEIMFQDVEMNEEVAAIRDEVMNNCQERYNDLVASGMSEDDAIAAVVESLKGMEDILAPYQGAKKPQEAGTTVKSYIFTAEEVQKINVSLVDEDVEIEPSEDAQYHVKWEAEDMPLVQCNVTNGVLRIDRKEGEAFVRRDEKERIRVSTKNGETTFDSLESALDDLGSVVDSTLRSVGATLRNLFGGKGDGVSIRFHFNNGKVIIQVPEGACPAVKLLTTSGDLTVGDVSLSALNLVTTSGDLDIDLNEDQQLSRVEIRTTSGDIEATLFAQEMNVGTTSGDVEVEGRVGSLFVDTVSGDVDVRADVTTMGFKTVSGDVDMEFDSDELREVSGSTISGDIDLDLPSGFGRMAIQTQTRSGDVHTHYSTCDVGPAVTGSLKSLSGDITIR